MKTPIVMVAVLAMATAAQAKPGKFDGFKLVSQRPAVHKNRMLHERTQAMTDQVAACGDTVGGESPIVKLHVAPDGSMLDVELKTKSLADETVACIRAALGALKYPAANKPSTVTWVLGYR